MHVALGGKLDADVTRIEVFLRLYCYLLCVNNSDLPNIVLLVMDTARAKTVLDKDGPIFPTLSSLSESGAYCKTAFADAPWTLPSHASLFTGTPPSVHGAHAGHKKLEEESITMAEVLSEAGYQTGAFTNNAWVTDEFGILQGFDDRYRIWQYLQSDVDFGPVAIEEWGKNQIYEGLSRLLNGDPLKNVVNFIYGKYLYRRTDYGAQRTNDLIRRWINTTSEPFFLFANYLEPHLEYRPPKEYASQFLTCDYDNAMSIPQDPWSFLCGEFELKEEDFQILHQLYKAEIAYLDDCIGELIGWLKQEGYFENTIIVIVGDHGENIGDHGLMDHQYCLYDTLIRVPLIIAGGPFNNKGQIRKQVQLSDIFPTLLEVTGVQNQEAKAQIQGRSFAPKTNKDDRSFVISEYLSPQPSLESLNDQFGNLPPKVNNFNRQLRSIRTSNYKLIIGSDDSIELYEINDSGSEVAIDVSDEHPGIVNKMVQKLQNERPEFPKTYISDKSNELDEGIERHLEDLGYL